MVLKITEHDKYTEISFSMESVVTKLELDSSSIKFGEYLELCKNKYIKPNYELYSDRNVCIKYEDGKHIISLSYFDTDWKGYGTLDSSISVEVPEDVWIEAIENLLDS